MIIILALLAVMDHMKLESDVMVGVILVDKMHSGGIPPKSVHCTLTYVEMCVVMHV